MTTIDYNTQNIELVKSPPIVKQLNAIFRAIPDIKAWANGAKKKTTDPDASWGAKLDTSGKKKFYFGYKVHLLVDTEYELPVAASVATASILYWIGHKLSLA